MQPSSLLLGVGGPNSIIAYHNSKPQPPQRAIFLKALLAGGSLVNWFISIFIRILNFKKKEKTLKLNQFRGVRIPRLI